MPTELLSSRPMLSPASDLVTPHLPLELIWLIIEQTLLQCLHSARKDEYVVAIPNHLIALNRAIHTLVVKLVYRTVILSSCRVLAKFLSLLTRSLSIADLVQNIWIGTPRLEAFAHQVGWVPCAVQRILEKAKNVKRLALPAAFFPPSPDRVAIYHLTMNGIGFTELPKETNTLHVYGLVRPATVRDSQRRGLRVVACELRRPCVPGAVGQFVRSLLEGTGIDMTLELVVPRRLRAWLDEELTGVQESWLYGSLKLRVVMTGSTDESPRDQWIRECSYS